MKRFARNSFGGYIPNLCSLQILILLCLLSDFANGQNVTLIRSGTIQTSVGTTSLSLHQSLHNPALSNGRDSVHNRISMFYVPSPLSISELATFQTSANYIVSNRFASALSVSSAGGNLFKELNATLSASYILDKSVQLGISGTYLSQVATGYDGVSSIGLNIGAILTVSEVVQTGFTLSNVLRSTVIESTSAYQEATFGIGVQVANNVSLDVDGIVILNRSSGFRVASKIELIEQLHLRCAVESLPQIGEVSLKIIPSESISAIVTTQYHTLLGFSYSGGAELRW